MSPPRPNVYLTCSNYTQGKERIRILPQVWLSLKPVTHSLYHDTSFEARVTFNFLSTEIISLWRGRAPLLPKPRFSRVCSMAHESWGILCEKRILQTGELGNREYLVDPNAHLRRSCKLFDLETFVLLMFDILKNTIGNVALTSRYLCPGAY